MTRLASRILLGLVVLGVGPAIAGEPSAAPAESSRKQFFFHWDLNASGFWSAEGADLSGTGHSHFLPTERPPRNYVGVDLLYALNDFRSVQERPFLLFDAAAANPHVEIDFHPLPKTDDFKQPNVDVFWLMQSFTGDDLHIRPKLIFYDLWGRFIFKGLDRTSLRIGHFDIPYGSNPGLAPKGGQFILPPEIEDIGFKKDWGAVWKGPLGEYDYELALTAGMGLGIHSPNWFDDTYPGTYCVSGRIGSPTYRRFQYGLSGMFGRLPLLVADEEISEWAENKWRLNVDIFYRHQTHTLVMAQAGVGRNYGRNGLAGIRPLVQPGTALSGRIFFGRSFRWLPSFDFSAQVASIWWRLEPRTPAGFAFWGNDHTYAVAEVAYSISSALILRLDYQHDFRSLMTTPVDDRVYFTLNFYR